MPEPKSPVVAGLQAFEVNIGGPQNNQPEYKPLPALKAADGRVTSRWELSDRDRDLIARGADIYVTLWCFDQPYTPTAIGVGFKDKGAEHYRSNYQLDALLLRRVAFERLRESGKKHLCFRCVVDECIALGAEYPDIPDHEEGCGGKLD